MDNTSIGDTGICYLEAAELDEEKYVRNVGPIYIDLFHGMFDSKHISSMIKRDFMLSMSIDDIGEILQITN